MHIKEEAFRKFGSGGFYLKNLYDTQGITGLTATVAGIVHRQIHSNTSQIYKKYK